MQISPHFSLDELTRSDTARRIGDPNKPGPITIAALRILAINVLEPIREHFGKPVRINSAYRSPKTNAAVGSKPTSDHVKGCAADIEISGVSNYELACWIRDNLQFKQVILEAYTMGEPSSGWVHVSFVGGYNRCECLTMNRGAYSKGLHA